jgi:hypothetical protein
MISGGPRPSPREYYDPQRAEYAESQASMRHRGVKYELNGKESLFLCEAHTESNVDATTWTFAGPAKEA